MVMLPIGCKEFLMCSKLELQEHPVKDDEDDCSEVR